MIKENLQLGQQVYHRILRKFGHIIDLDTKDNTSVYVQFEDEDDSFNAFVQFLDEVEEDPEIGSVIIDSQNLKSIFNYLKKNLTIQLDCGVSGSRVMLYLINPITKERELISENESSFNNMRLG